MKKLLITSILSISGLMADTYFQIGSNNQTFQNENAAGFDIGYGFTKPTDTNIYLGIGFKLSYAKLNEKILTSFSGDFKAGYTYKYLSIYALGSALQQSYIVNGYGFGMGSGLEYRLTQEVSIVLEYISYDMTNKYEDYDYKQTALGLTYNF